MKKETLYNRHVIDKVCLSFSKGSFSFYIFLSFSDMFFFGLSLLFFIKKIMK